MSEWIEVGLHEILKVKHGFAFSGEFFTNEPQQTALVTPGNFAIGGGFKNAKPKYYKGPVPSGYVLQPDQVVVTMTDLSKDGDTLGYSAVIPDDGINWLHNQRVGVLEFNQQVPVAPPFVHYLLRTENYRSWIIGSATGTTVRHTSPGRIESYRCLIPPISEQQAISHILGTFDDKIERNRRTNETLEAMAQALFKDWFIHFGPVRAKMENREPYLNIAVWNLLPDKLAGDGGPQGWRWGPVSDWITFNPPETLRKGDVAPYLDMAALPTQGCTPDAPIQREFGSGMKFRGLPENLWVISAG